MRVTTRTQHTRANGRCVDARRRQLSIDSEALPTSPTRDALIDGLNAECGSVFFVLDTLIDG